MELPDAITGGLPAPRDDEPAHLRQDLVDELNDHLQAALDRELRTVPDAAQAWQNVLARFGDPRKVLRELWYQAMKEQIMSQRVMLILGGIMVVACLAALSMTWMLVQQSQSTQAALLDKIAALTAQSAGPQKPNPSDWSPVKVRLVQEDGSPARGFKAELTGKLIDEQEVSLAVVPDAQGVADFSWVRIGRPLITVSAPWGELLRKYVYVRPGEDVKLDIVCPAQSPGEGEVSFQLTLPVDLRDRGLWTMCYLAAEPRAVDGQTWHSPSKRVVLNDQGRIVAAGNDTRGIGSDGFVGLIQDDVAQQIQELRGKPMANPTTAPAVESSDPAATAQLLAVDYTLKSLAILKPEPAATADAKVMGLGATRSGQFAKFVSMPGERNEFTIALPDSLIEQVRKALAPRPVPVATTPSTRPINNPNPSEWSRVRVKFVFDDEAKSPAAGIRATLTGFVLSHSEKTTLNATSDGQGVADFGLVRMGSHELTALGARDDFMTREILVRPNQGIGPTIVCPTPPQEVDVDVRLEWPPDLRDKGLLTLCFFYALPRQVGDAVWNSSPYSTVVLLDVQGRVLRTAHGQSINTTQQQPEGDSSGMTFAPVIPSPFSVGNRSVDVPPKDLLSLLPRDFFTAPAAQPTHTARLYDVKQVANVWLVALPNAKADGKGEGPPSFFAGAMGMMPEDIAAGTLLFDPVLEQANHWTVPLPLPLLEQVRKKLAEQTKP